MTTLRVRVPQRQAFEFVMDAPGKRFGGTRVGEFTTEPADAGEDDPLSALTIRQRDVLQTAVNAGYFEHPRTRSGTEVAERLGVSRQAFDQVLRAAQRNLLAELLGED